MDYPIDGQLRKKSVCMQFLKSLITKLGRLNLGQGFWKDCVDEDGALTLDGKPHGVFVLVPSDSNPEVALRRYRESCSIDVWNNLVERESAMGGRLCRAWDGRFWCENQYSKRNSSSGGLLPFRRPHQENV